MLNIINYYMMISKYLDIFLVRNLVEKWKLTFEKSDRIKKTLMF
jgi:hypothetical protein